MNRDPIADHDAYNLIGRPAEQFAAAYERYVNEHGVAVRRLTLTGAEEVDPQAKQAA